MDRRLLDILYNYKKLKGSISVHEINTIGFGKNDFNRQNTKSMKDLARIKLKQPLLYYSNGFFNYKVIKSARSGTIVGEASLETQDKRAATCFTGGATVLLELTQDAFNKLFNHLLNDNSSKINFIQRLFPNISENRLLNIAYLFEEIYLERGNTVFRQGDKCDCLYLLGQGKVEMVRMPDHKLGQQAEVFSSSKKGEQVMEISDCEKKLEALKVKRTKITLLDYKNLGIVGKGGIIGVEVLDLTPPNSRRYTVKVVSHAVTLYKLKKSNFSDCSYLLSQNWIWFQQKCRKRSKWIIKQIKETRPPKEVMTINEGVRSYSLAEPKKDGNNKIKSMSQSQIRDNDKSFTSSISCKEIGINQFKLKNAEIEPKILLSNRSLDYLNEQEKELTSHLFPKRALKYRIPKQFEEKLDYQK